MQCIMLGLAESPTVVTRDPALDSIRVTQTIGFTMAYYCTACRNNPQYKCCHMQNDTPETRVDIQDCACVKMGIPQRDDKLMSGSGIETK